MIGDTGQVPHSSVGKESACNAGDLGSIPGSGRSPGEGNGNPLQYSCLENPMDRGAWRESRGSHGHRGVHGVTRVRHDLATKPPPWFRSLFKKYTNPQLSRIICGKVYSFSAELPWHICQNFTIDTWV